MKKISSLLLALFATITISAQLVVQNTGMGTLKLTYGATNDYTIYDPGFEVPTFYVHVWSNAGDNTTSTIYDDSWNNSTVTMNWDSTAFAYVGTINLNTKVFTNGNKVMPIGTTVNNLGFVFKDLQNGATKQSNDLSATTYGFTPTTLGVLDVSNNNLAKKSIVIDGKLHTSIKGNITVSVYEISGKLVTNFTANSNGNSIDLNVRKNGIYLLKIAHGSQTEVVKFAK